MPPSCSSQPWQREDGRHERFSLALTRGGAHGGRLLLQNFSHLREMPDECATTLVALRAGGRVAVRVEKVARVVARKVEQQPLVRLHDEPIEESVADALRTDLNHRRCLRH